MPASVQALWMQAAPVGAQRPQLELQQYVPLTQTL
jgi:hypothetical protein